MHGRVLKGGLEVRSVRIRPRRGRRGGLYIARGKERGKEKRGSPRDRDERDGGNE